MSTGELRTTSALRSLGVYLERERIKCPICGKEAVTRVYNEFKKVWEYKHRQKLGKARAELGVGNNLARIRSTYCFEKCGSR